MTDEDIASKFGSAFAGLFGMHAEPPDGVLLRTLGLAEKPASHDAVKSAFRARVMQVHPDVAAYTDPGLRMAAEALAAGTPEVQELVWARDELLRKIPRPTPVTDNTFTPRVRREPSRCKVCDRVDGQPYRILRSSYGRRLHWVGYCTLCARDAENARTRERRRAARVRPCHACGATFTPSRADGRYCTQACRQTAYRNRRAVA